MIKAGRSSGVELHCSHPLKLTNKHSKNELSISLWSPIYLTNSFDKSKVFWPLINVFFYILLMYFCLFNYPSSLVWFCINQTTQRQDQDDEVMPGSIREFIVKHLKLILQNIFSHSEFSKWSPWGLCSKTCGRGIKIRTRTCEDPPPCVGPTEKTRQCSNKKCREYQPLNTFFLVTNRQTCIGHT